MRVSTPSENKDVTRPVTAHVPIPLFQELRHAAYIHEIPMSEIMRDGIRMRLKELESETTDTGA